MKTQRSPFKENISTFLRSLAIPGLIRYVVLFNALVFLLIFFQPAYGGVLILDPAKVLQGELWRVVTWIFIPPTLSPLWLIFALMLLWMYGEALEAIWGTLKLNLFYLSGMVGCTAAAFFTGQAEAYNVLLNLSLFFAFATLHPDVELLLFFILPVKIKWIAYATLMLLGWQLVDSTVAFRVAAGIALLNYLIFFAPTLWTTLQAFGMFRSLGFFGALRAIKAVKALGALNTGESVSAGDARGSNREATRKPRGQVGVLASHLNTESDVAFHHCVICGGTELSLPYEDFRVAADGQEYCSQHLLIQNSR